MQQRRLRLGDILDDYCPRERRITNHAVVAMIDDTVKQTRCTTCDSDHEYKGAKVPATRRKKASAPAAHLVDRAGRAPTDPTPDEMPAGDELRALPADEVIAETDHAVEVSPTPRDPDVVEAEPPAERDDADQDEWPVHRPLIRATLPRPEGTPPDRKAPDFTFRPTGGRFDRNGQRNRGNRSQRQAHGSSSSGQGQRFGGQRPAGQGQRGPGHGGPHGQRHGNRSGQGGGSRPGQGRGPRTGGGRKRGR